MLPLPKKSFTQSIVVVIVWRWPGRFTLSCFVEWAADPKVDLTLVSINNNGKHLGDYELELVDNDWDHSTNNLSHIIYPKHCSMKAPPKSLPNNTTICWSRTLNPSLLHYPHPPQSHWYSEGGHPHLSHHHFNRPKLPISIKPQWMPWCVALHRLVAIPKLQKQGG